MGKSAAPRKKYKPPARPASATPINWRQSRGTDAHLALIPHQCLERLREGRADFDDMGSINLRLLWAKRALELHFDAEATHMAAACIGLALDALLTIKARLDAAGKIGASGAELVALGDGIKAADEIAKACTRRECADALKTAAHEMGCYFQD